MSQVVKTFSRFRNLNFKYYLHIIYLKTNIVGGYTMHYHCLFPWTLVTYMNYIWLITSHISQLTLYLWTISWPVNWGFHHRHELIYISSSVSLMLFPILRTSIGYVSLRSLSTNWRHVGISILLIGPKATKWCFRRSHIFLILDSVNAIFLHIASWGLLTKYNFHPL